MVAPPRLGILASGGGSNALALIRAHQRGDLPTPVAVVVSNNSRAGALEHARENRVAAVHISSRTHDDPDRAMLECFRDHDVGVVICAGYLKLVGPRVLREFAGRILNIHPAPLPRFGGAGMFGRHVHEAVLASEATHSGPTIHMVTDRYDEGPVLAHTPVPVEPGDTADTLARRVLAAEHDLYWRAIRDQFCQ